MKLIKEFGVILAISFAGELLNLLLPLPIPASIYGLVLMFFCLKTRIVTPDKIGSTWKFLIEIMPLMFIPAGVGLLDSWGVLQPMWIPILTITLVTTVVVMAVSGRVTQAILRAGRRSRQEAAEHE